MISIFTLMSCNSHDHSNNGRNNECNDGINFDNYNKIIYHNDFSDSSLCNLIIGERGTATVNVEQGQLVIKPGEGYKNRGFIAIDLSVIPNKYNSRLDNNTKKITWAFNVSNKDGSVCGSCNNLFSVSLYGFPDTDDGPIYGYTFQGGGFLGNRMVLSKHSAGTSTFGSIFDILIDITNGLDTLPVIGAIKITYDPSFGSWELYYEESTSAINPLTITNLIGTAINNDFSNEPLPYLILSGKNTAATYFDNLTIRFED